MVGRSIGEAAGALEGGVARCVFRWLSLCFCRWVWVWRKQQMVTAVVGMSVGSGSRGVWNFSVYESGV